MRGEGWKWVEILPFANYSDLSKFDRIYPVHMPVSPEIRSEIEALQAEQEQISQAHQDAEEYPPDVDERMAELEERIEELNDQTKQYREEEKKLAGAVVSIESIHRGLVRSEDKRKVQAAKSGGDTENQTGGNGGEESAEVQLSAALAWSSAASKGTGFGVASKQTEIHPEVKSMPAAATAIIAVASHPSILR